MKTKFLVVLAAVILQIFACKGKDGAPGGTSVYDANDVLLGELTLGSGAELGILFSDSKVGAFLWNGTYSNGFCLNATSGNCSAAVTISTVKTLYSYTATEATTKSYTFYTTADCSGTAYIHFKPIKGAIFRGASAFYTSDGNESQSTGLSIGSMYFYDRSSCLGTAGSGVCCSNMADNDGVAITTATGYALTNYTFPDGLTYPFTGPLYIK